MLVLIPVCFQCCCASFVTVLSRRLSGLITLEIREILLLCEIFRGCYLYNLNPLEVIRLVSSLQLAVLYPKSLYIFILFETIHYHILILKISTYIVLVNPKRGQSLFSSPIWLASLSLIYHIYFFVVVLIYTFM